MMRNKTITDQELLDRLQRGVVWEGVGVEHTVQRRVEREISVRFWTRKNADRYVVPVVGIAMLVGACLFMSMKPSGTVMRVATFVAVLAVIVGIGVVDFFGPKLHIALGKCMDSFGMQRWLYVRSKTYARRAPREVPVRIEVAMDEEKRGVVLRWSTRRSEVQSLPLGPEELVGVDGFGSEEIEVASRLYAERLLGDGGEVRFSETSVVWMRDAYVEGVVYVQLRSREEGAGVTFRMQAPSWMDPEELDRLPQIASYGVELGMAQEREFVRVLALWMELSGQGRARAARAWLEQEEVRDVYEAATV